MKRIILVLFACLLVLSAVQASQKKENWIGTWATAPLRITPDNMPPTPGLAHNSLRQVVKVSIGGDKIRVKLSNEYSQSQLEIKSVYVAVSQGGGNIDARTAKYVSFKGKRQVSVSKGGMTVSDPVPFKMSPLQQIAITINYGETPQVLTGHPGSRTTSYIINGESKPQTDFAKAATTDHWYTISGMDVEEADGACVAILGNSITDGRGSTTNAQNRWPDMLASQLQKNASTKKIGVLNLGIGGNSVVRGGLGDLALKRYTRDILSQSGVKWMIIYEGVNDLGGCKDGKAMADQLIAAYQRMIAKAHAHGILVYGGTITPFKNHSYFTEEHELGRSVVNEWIRKSGWFDAVIDFDKMIRDNVDTMKINDAYQSDYLHPNADGYRVMGESVDLNLFSHASAWKAEMPKDKNFQVYLAFGQSNMEGQGKIEEQDKSVSNRFKMMPAVDCPAMNRTAGVWTSAVPPLCRCSTGLCPVDYFGRTLVDSLPENINVGVINVSVAGCRIELFDKDTYPEYVKSGLPDWMKNMVADYGGNPYERLVSLARKAQQDGVIKGVLIHQGESNTGDSTWLKKVRTIYYYLMNDLHLDPDSVPLVAGEVVNSDQNGQCGSMNNIIDLLPTVIPNSYVVSSAGCVCNQMDHLHFVSAGYRELGTRYARQMLNILKQKDHCSGASHR